MLYPMMVNTLRKVKPTIPVFRVLLFCFAFGGLPLDAPAALGGTLEAKDYLEFDQLIYEHTGPTGPAWIHVSYSKKGNRGQILQAIKVGSRTTYLPYKL